MNNTTIEDIQIRLNCFIDESLFATTWYGPGDAMRFAVLISASRLYTKEEKIVLELQAKELFSEKIIELEKVLKEIV